MVQKEEESRPQDRPGTLQQIAQLGSDAMGWAGPPRLLEAKACMSEGLCRAALAVAANLGAEAGRIFALLTDSMCQVLPARAFPKQVWEQIGTIRASRKGEEGNWRVSFLRLCS